MIDGITGVSGQLSTHFSAEWHGDTIATDQVNFGRYITLNGVYSFAGNTATQTRRGYAYSPAMPTFLLEEPYDEEGYDGTGKNPSATQPVRRFIWWSVLNGIGGYMAGNGYLIHFFPGYTSHFNSQGQLDLRTLNVFWQSIPWYQLVPSGLGGMKTIVTSGGNSPSNTNYVAAAATPGGTWMVAYIPPAHSGTITVDMTVMSGSARARWLNPTTGAYSTLGTFANTGTRVFTPPGDNGTGSTDWVLVLDKQ
jgi:hypothetical protein